MKDIQQKINTFVQENNMRCSSEIRMLDLLSELGEVSKEIIKMTDYGTQPATSRPELKGELGDTLFSLITLANELDVDLESALEETLTKYEKRLKKGSAGSEND